MSDKQNKVFAENLRQLIDQKGVMKSEFAKAIGVSNGQISHWLNGRSMPKSDQWQKIADYFHINKSELLFDESDYEMDSGVLSDEGLLRLIDYYRMMSPECQLQLREMAKTLAKLSEVKKDD